MAYYKVINTYIMNQCSTFTVPFVLKHFVLDHLSLASPYG